MNPSYHFDYDVHVCIQISVSYIIDINAEKE